jgi:2-iminobutanoate/2-iminopropanoate deaminase
MTIIRHSPPHTITGGPYVPAVEIEHAGFRQLYVSGQGTTDPNTRERNLGPIESQASAALNNLKNVLEKCGYTMQDVVKVTLYLVNMADFPIVNDIYRSYFEQAHYPARSTVAVKELPGGQHIEIDAIAVRS